MPPLLTESDNESDDLDMIPAKPSAKAAKPLRDEDTDEEEAEGVPKETKAQAGKIEVDEDDEDGEDDEEEDEDTFAVEKITQHDWNTKKKVLYRVKWLGYNNPKDQTWEPKENLIDGAADVLQNYWDEHCGGEEPIHPTLKNKKAGGTPQSAKAGRPKRKLDESLSESPAPTVSKRARKNDTAKKSGTEGNGDINFEKKYLRASCNWEKAVTSINLLEEYRDSKSTPDKPSTSLLVYLTFDGTVKKTFPMNTVRERCPQKLLDYYQQHLKFRCTNDEEVDADAKSE